MWKEKDSCILFRFIKATLAAVLSCISDWVWGSAPKAVCTMLDGRTISQLYEKRRRCEKLFLAKLKLTQGACHAPASSCALATQFTASTALRPLWICQWPYLTVRRNTTLYKVVAGATFCRYLLVTFYRWYPSDNSARLRHVPQFWDNHHSRTKTKPATCRSQENIQTAWAPQLLIET